MTVRTAYIVREPYPVVLASAPGTGTVAGCSGRFPCRRILCNGTVAGRADKCSCRRSPLQ